MSKLVAVKAILLAQEVLTSKTGKVYRMLALEDVSSKDIIIVTSFLNREPIQVCSYF